VCDRENLKNEEAMTCVGSQRHRKKKTFLNNFMSLSDIVALNLKGMTKKFKNKITSSVILLIVTNCTFFLSFSESNEICDLETSPSNMGEDCLSVDMIPE
jgi:hypothetical protein